MSAHSRNIIRLVIGLLVCVIIPCSIYVQSYQCSDCRCLERRGMELEKKDSLTAAIRLYTAAKECNPARTLEMNRRIEAIFAKIDGIRNQAVRDEQAARKNITRTATLQKQAKQDAAEAERQKNDALAAKATADSARVLAEVGRREADSLEIVFKEQEIKTRQTLTRLDKALDDLAREYARQAMQQIYQLNYDSAQTLAGKASTLRREAVTDSLQGLYLELSYVCSEAELLDRLQALTDSLAVHYDRPAELKGNLYERRKALEILDSTQFQMLEQRYYPEMVIVPGGTFLMGTTKDMRKQVIKRFGREYGKKDVKDWTKDEMPAHSVTLDSFEMALTETTWWQYALYCRSKQIDLPRAPSWGRQGDHPVVNVSWNDAQGYLEWLHTRSPGAYSLPTEAEWEYAARGGAVGSISNYLFAGSNDIDEVGWYGKNSGGTPKAVGGKESNQLGLYDMSGNVWEWCADWYSDYSKIAQANPKGPEKGEGRVLRGGSWVNDVNNCRSAIRVRDNPDVRDDDVGFRVSRHFK